MIQKISNPGKGFRGVLNYCLDAKKLPERVAGTMAGEDARNLAREFRDARAANEEVRKPVFHASLSADPQDRLTAEQWRQIAETYVERMGYGDCLWVAVRHRDTDHDHLHIIASRITHDGRRVADWQERKRGEAIVRDLEREHDIRQVAPSHEAGRAAPGRGELAGFARTGQVGVKARLQELVELAARDRPTMGEFGQRLEALGVGVRLNLARTGRVSGISYELDGVAMKGSALGRAYSWGGLQERQGVRYDADRDLPILRTLSQAPTRRRAPEDRGADPDGPPMPPLDKPAQAYRDAAVLASRVDVHERERRLHDEERQAGGASSAAGQVLDERRRAERRLDAREELAFRQLARVYEDPQAARTGLRERISRDGYDRAAQVLEQTPGELGRLRGVAVGTLRSPARREALDTAAWVAHELRDIGRERARLAAGEPEAAKAAADVATANRRAAHLARLRRRLPDLGQVHRDLHRAAQALGAAAVKGMSGRAANVVTRVALRIARDLARDRDRLER
ncbi:MAG TPA: relaxase/mobilization nuclease domain-containing protein [Thermoanaerobaculia bacterium]|nr:relaxase/mobilization nuclease domain-containing protein [Thermoanaerobaculia bacterium]